MEIVTRGCTLPVDLVIGDLCVGGSVGGSLLATVGLFLMFGAFRYSKRNAIAAFKSKEQNEADNEIDQVGRTLRSLVAVAAADGRLDDTEVKVIRYVCAKHFQVDVSEELIRSMYTKIGKVIDIEAEIRGNFGDRSLQDPKAISALIDGMVAVAACDGELSTEERLILERICCAFGSDKNTTQRLIEKAQEDAEQWMAAAAA